MSAPRVSIVMPVYNAAAFLDEALESLLAQTMPDFELLCLDDGSSDGSAEKLAAWAARDGRIAALCRPHRGIVATLNEGFSLARSALIARMDADDVALPERLERQVAFLDTHPDIGGVGCSSVEMDAAGKTFGVRRPPCAPEAVTRQLKKSNCLIHPTILLRRAALGNLSYRAPFALAEDYDLWLRLSERAPLANLEDALLRYRVGVRPPQTEHLEQQVRSTLAARRCARERRAGRPDPAEHWETVPEDFLAPAELSQELQRSALSRARAARRAGDGPTADFWRDYAANHAPPPSDWRARAAYLWRRTRA